MLSFFLPFFFDHIKLNTFKLVFKITNNRKTPFSGELQVIWWRVKISFDISCVLCVLHTTAQPQQNNNKPFEEIHARTHKCNNNRETQNENKMRHRRTRQETEDDMQAVKVRVSQKQQLFGLRFLCKMIPFIYWCEIYITQIFILVFWVLHHTKAFEAFCGFTCRRSRQLHADRCEHRWIQMRDEEWTPANLQIHSDCPADWCKCECHSLSPEEEESHRQSQSSRGETVSVSVFMKKISSLLVDPLKEEEHHNHLHEESSS